MDCIFCKIIKRELEAYIIYEDDIAIAFLDVNPEVNGHMLIIPKKHIENISDIDDKTLAYLYKIGEQMYRLLKKTFLIEGITFVQNNGCSQDIKHFHIHLIPRCIDDHKLKPTYINQQPLALPLVYEKLLANKEK